MKKNGFTLAELLITLGIIGIIGAVGAVAIGKLNPDKNKVLYFKASEMLEKTVKNLMYNRDLYPYRNVSATTPWLNQVFFEPYPLLNVVQPSISPYNNAKYSGDRKLCSLIGISLGVSDSALNCQTNPFSPNTQNFSRVFFNNNISFVTPNGMRWVILPKVQAGIRSNARPRNAKFQVDVYVDVNPENNGDPSNNKNCMYNANTCTSPDIYKFMISANGKIEPADQMGIAYTKTRRVLTRMQYNDIIVNENILPISALSDNGTWFPYKNQDGEDVPPCDGGKIMVGKSCVAPNEGECQHWEVLENDKCVSICSDGYEYVNGKCTYCNHGVDSATGRCKTGVVVTNPPTGGLIEDETGDGTGNGTGNGAGNGTGNGTGVTDNESSGKTEGTSGTSSPGGGKIESVDGNMYDRVNMYDKNYYFEKEDGAAISRNN